MLQAPETIRESLNALLETLDSTAGTNQEAPARRNRRVRLRRAFRTECAVKCFPGGGSMQTLPAVTRNISYRGMSVLIQAELICGQPVEVRIDLPDQEPTYVAGVVAFRRKVQQDHFETGFQIQAAGPRPVFDGPPVTPAPDQDWLAEALTTVDQ
ncbi:MAG TPA: PilZ domain-containing protein [Phycisphaerae bacterium]|nr:PilZ domain-containing protein [Phycisphaerae bacterium]